jgi:SAM-dependent methyltransferase
MDRIYREVPLTKIPWNLENPPDLLVDLVRSGWVVPCETIDLGCGAGNQAVWLARQGFQVTGVDISEVALDAGRQRAAREGVSCRFVALDLTKDVRALGASFDFAYDWEVLHHIFPADRELWVPNVHRMLRARGRYVSVCFSETDSFAGSGKYRTTGLGTTLYFSSEPELRALFEPWFEIEGLATVEIAGRFQPHRVVTALMIKRG